MDKTVKYFVLICSILNCKGISFREQREENIFERQERQSSSDEEVPSRRVLAHTADSIMGAPSLPSHLPEAEPILPGHTLIRPALGMLKSAVKFPHKDLDNGAGVYGNVDTLGLRYDGQNQRVLYSGFRRSNLPADYIVVSPLKTRTPQSKDNLKFIVSSVVLDLDREKDVSRKILNALRRKRRNVGSTRIIQVYPSKPASSVYRSASSSQKPFLRRNVLPNLKIFVLKNAKKDNEKKALRSVVENDSSPEQSSSEKENHIDHSDIESEVDNKKNWFWNSKDTFDHLKLNQEAPEQIELMPANLSNNLRNWWFFSQDDYEPFTNNLDQ